LSSALEELVLHLLAKRPEQRPASAATVAERLRPFVAGTAPAHPANLRVLGRPVQVRAGGEFVAAPRPGAMLLFRGAPGSGRGRLVDAAADEAFQRGMRVIQYDAGEGGLRGLAAQLVGFSGELDPPGLEQTARAALRDPGPALLGAAIAARARVEPAGVLVAARALHRCTPVQREVLAEVLRVARDRGAPAILVGTIGESAPLPGPGAEIVEVPPLSPAETATLASQSLGVSQVPPELVRKLHRLSGGLPVLVEAMLRGLPAGRATGVLAIPAELSAAAALRVAGLERIERRVAELVAMAPGDTDAEHSARAIDEEPSAVLAAVEGLVADGVLARQGAGWAFRVGLCAEAVRAATRASRRAVLVKRLARMASELQPSRSLAEILLEAERPPEALAVGVAWAGGMVALGLHAEVAELLERLLRAPGTTARHATAALLYAECLAETAPRGAEVDAALAAARAAATTPEARGEVALIAARLARARGDVFSERFTLAEAVGTIPSPPRVAAARDRLAEAAMAMGDLADALEFAAAAARDLPGARTRATLAAALAERGDLRAADIEARAALSASTGGGSSAWRASAALAKSLRAEGRLSEAHDALERCLVAARSEAPAQRLAAVLLAMAEVDFDLFRVGQARERVQQAVDAVHGEVPPRLEAQHALLQARLLAEVESYPLALAAIDAGLERASTRGQRAAAALMLGVRGALVGFAGRGSGVADFEAARVELAEMGAFPAFATVASLQARVSGGSADPEALFGPLQGWMAIEPARVARLEFHLARVRRARRAGEPLTGPLTDAQHLYLEIRGWLSPLDAAALAVHPWARVLGM
jgi:tetratricopeptide (TPR) repeat protein